MCTVSWFTQPDGYTLYFNRDESRNRPDGIPPRHETIGETRVIYPRDPVGNGTWLLVNEHGCSLGLLNYYEAALAYQPEKPESRGQLPIKLADCETADAVETRLNAMDFTPYPPFHLLALDRNGSASLTTWDGAKKTGSHPTWHDQPISTSSFKTAEVLAGRRTLFQETVLNSPHPVRAMRTFHTHELPTPATHAVLMIRKDAKTVSVSRIDVSAKEIRMSYRSRPHDSERLAKRITQTLPPAGQRPQV